jgi:GT2 family glycosyltransferase
MRRPPAPLGILDVELADGAPVLPRRLDRPALVLLRWRGAVIGRAHLMPSDLPMTVAEAAAFAAANAGPTIAERVRLGDADDRMTPLPRPATLHPLDAAGLLAALERALTARRSQPVTVSASIAVCTRDRPADLADCLAAIRAATGNGIETIVVDNGPGEATEQVTRATGARYVAEPRPGLNRARNAALRASERDVVVFVDDDVRPEAGFAEALLRRFDRADVAVVTALVLPLELRTGAQVGFEYELGFGGMELLPLAFDRDFLDGWRWAAPVWDIGAGATMAVRREAALRIGGFDERIGAGVLGGCGDDTEFWHNVLHHGLTIRYEPLAVVRHRHREDDAALRRQAAGYAKGHLVSLFATHARGAPGALARAFVFLPLWYARRAAALPGHAIMGHPDRLFLASLGGYLAGLRHVGLAFHPSGPASAPVSDTADAKPL